MGVGGGGGGGGGGVVEYCDKEFPSSKLCGYGMGAGTGEATSVIDNCCNCFRV